MKHSKLITFVLVAIVLVLPFIIGSIGAASKANEKKKEEVKIASTKKTTDSKNVPATVTPTKKPSQTSIKSEQKPLKATPTPIKATPTPKVPAKTKGGTLVFESQKDVKEAPQTGAEALAMVSLLSSGAVGFALRRIRA